MTYLFLPCAPQKPLSNGVHKFSGRHTVYPRYSAAGLVGNGRPAWLKYALVRKMEHSKSDDTIAYQQQQTESIPWHNLHPCCRPNTECHFRKIVAQTNQTKYRKKANAANTKGLDTYKNYHYISLSLVWSPTCRAFFKATVGCIIVTSTTPARAPITVCSKGVVCRPISKLYNFKVSGTETSHCNSPSKQTFGCRPPGHPRTIKSSSKR